MFLKVSWSAVVFVPGGQFPEVDSTQQGQHASVYYVRYSVLLTVYHIIS